MQWSKMCQFKTLRETLKSHSGNFLVRIWVFSPWSTIFWHRAHKSNSIHYYQHLCHDDPQLTVFPSFYVSSSSVSLSVCLSVSSCLTPLCSLWSPSRALLISGFTSRTTQGTQTTWAGSRSGSISSTAKPQGNMYRSWGRKLTPMEMMGTRMVWENSCASHPTLTLVC